MPGWQARTSADLSTPAAILAGSLLPSARARYYRTQVG